MVRSLKRVQVVETAAEGEDFFPARELLPWADPYIASLMGRLEGQNDAEQADELADPTWDFDYEPLDEEDEEALSDDLTPEDDWHLDGEPAYPPTYGGWPLLNDLRSTGLPVKG
jgi:hypothetical protein